MLVRKFRRAPSVARRPPNQLFHWTSNLTLRRRYGRQFHCRPSLRRPGLFTPPVNRALGTKCLPVTFYLVQGCPTRAARSGRTTFVRIEQSLFTAVPPRCSENATLRTQWAIGCVDARRPIRRSAARAVAPAMVQSCIATVCVVRPKDACLVRVRRRETPGSCLH
jgi:hypothetical protein